MRRYTTIAYTTIAPLLLALSIPASAHDMFLKLRSHYLAPQEAVAMTLVNGTFEVSENSIALDRIRDARITGPDAQVRTPAAGQWSLDTTQNTLRFDSGKTGTYVAGVSTRPRVLEMTAEAFDRYLEHDGVLDVLEARRTRAAPPTPVTEKYSKHVKTVFQVGEQHTDSFRRRFGYPIEIVPLLNPGSLAVGDALPVQVLWQGKPATGQRVYASFAGFHAHDDQGTHVEAVSTRTDDEGIAEISLQHDGVWYLRLIHMTASKEPGIDYESNWATLTFEVRRRADRSRQPTGH